MDPSDFIPLGEECRDLYGPIAGQADAGSPSKVACADTAARGGLIRTADSGASVLNAWAEGGDVVVFEAQVGNQCHGRERVACGGIVQSLTLTAATSGVESIIGTDTGLYWNSFTTDGILKTSCTLVAGPGFPNTSPSWLIDGQRRILVHGNANLDQLELLLFNSSLGLQFSQQLGIPATAADAALESDVLLVVAQGTDGRLFNLAGGVPVAIRDIVFSTAPVLNPRAVALPDGFLVAWWEGGDPREVWAAQLDTSGSFVAGPRFVVAGMQPDLAVSGSDVAIVHTEEQVTPTDAYCLPILWWRKLGDDLSVESSILIGSAGADGTSFEYELRTTLVGFRVASREEVWARGPFGPRLVCGAPMITEIAAGAVQTRYIPGIE